MTDVLILLICLFFTLYGVGMIWVLQLNHYPLYARVGREGFKVSRITLPLTTSGCFFRSFCRA